jgi:hypothetical protein
MWKVATIMMLSGFFLTYYEFWVNVGINLCIRQLSYAIQFCYLNLPSSLCSDKLYQCLNNA